MNCPSCGAANHPDFAFCLQCGHSLAAPAPTADLGAETRAVVAPIDQGPAPMRLDSVPHGGLAGSPAVTARLRVEQGSVDEAEIPLDRPELIIGRRQDSDVIIHDTNVSRHHARIIRDGNRLQIEDTNSSNGTIVNDERIEGVRDLRSGDVVRIGDAVFVVEIEDASYPSDHDAPEGSTMAIELEDSSPMTQIGGVPELVPPELIPPQPAPLTPPPPIMEVRQPEAREPEPRHPAASDSNMSGAAAGGPAQSSLAAGGSTSAELDALRKELTDVGQELLSFSGTLGGLADRIEALERALDAATGDLASVADAVRGPDASTLRELQAIVGEIERSEDGPGLEDATRVLEQLASQPRDIELLLKLSQQAGALERALRLHARLVAVAPRLGGVLGRLVG